MAMRKWPDGKWPGRRWRGLILFWALTLGVLGAGAVALQLLGPGHPPPVKTAETPPRDAAPTRHVAATSPEPQAHAVSEAGSALSKPAAPPPQAPPSGAARPGSTLVGSASAGPIAAPDPALLEPGQNPDTGMLPRIGANGRTPGQVYARAFSAEPGRKRIGLVLAGIGMNAADSARAIASLPGELTLAVSPYAPQNPALLEQARQAGHELLLAIPMEPVGFPLNDPGEHALLTGATEAQNHRNLEWALGRFAGYAGATAALGGQLNGERFPTIPEQMRTVLTNLAARGLFYLDPRIAPVPETGGSAPALPYVWNRSIDLVVDDPADAASLEAKLAALEAIARDQGSALGLVGTPTPVALERLAAWTNGLAARGFVLTPASALMRPPGDVPE